jgi:hypothetical protein
VAAPAPLRIAVAATVLSEDHTSRIHPEIRLLIPGGYHHEREDPPPYRQRLPQLSPEISGR